MEISGRQGARNRDVDSLVAVRRMEADEDLDGGLSSDARRRQAGAQDAVVRMEIWTRATKELLDEQRDTWYLRDGVVLPTFCCYYISLILLIGNVLIACPCCFLAMQTLCCPSCQMWPIMVGGAFCSSLLVVCVLQTIPLLNFESRVQQRMEEHIASGRIPLRSECNREEAAEVEDDDDSRTKVV